MKKIIFLSIVFFTIFSLSFGVVTYVTIDWANSITGLSAAMNGGYYNFSSGHFILCDTYNAGVHFIRTASGTDGSLIGTMSLSGLNIGATSFGVFSVCVAQDSKIYGGCTNKTDGSAGNSLVTWADESATPTQQDPAPFGTVNMEFPRAIDAVGSGTSTIIGVTGTNDYKVTFLTTTDGTIFAVTDNTPIASLNVTEQIKQGVAVVATMDKVYGVKADGAGVVCRLNKGAPAWAAAPGFTPPANYTAPPTGLGVGCIIGYSLGHNAVFVIGNSQTNDYLSVLDGDTGALLIPQIQIGVDVGQYGYGSIDLDEEAGVGYFIGRGSTSTTYVCGKFSFDPYVIPTKSNVWNIYE